MSSGNAREAIASHFATLPMNLPFRLQSASERPLEQAVMRRLSDPSSLLH
jgi:hypothetical protein